jgi:hypothetical protein
MLDLLQETSECKILQRESKGRTELSRQCFPISFLSPSFFLHLPALRDTVARCEQSGVTILVSDILSFSISSDKTKHVLQDLTYICTCSAILTLERVGIGESCTVLPAPSLSNCLYGWPTSAQAFLLLQPPSMLAIYLFRPLSPCTNYGTDFIPSNRGRSRNLVPI